jgi:hypothetical protein
MRTTTTTDLVGITLRQNIGSEPAPVELSLDNHSAWKSKGSQTSLTMIVPVQDPLSDAFLRGPEKR